MKRKNLVLAAAAAAILGAFNPVLADGDVSPGVNVGSSGDESVSSGLSASESSTDSNRPSNAELSAAATESIIEAPDSGDKQSLN